MAHLSWAQISGDGDQQRALQQISGFFHENQSSFMQKDEMAHVMMAMAAHTMDYDDPRDMHNDLGSRDPERSRNYRFGNFMDYVFEFAAKRLVFAGADDAYLGKKDKLFKEGRNTPRLAQSFSDAGRAAELDVLDNNGQPLDIEDSVHVFDVLKGDMLASGLPRLSIAKAFLDASFVLARAEASKESYAAFCRYIKTASTPPPAPENTAKQMASSFSAQDHDALSEQAFLALEGVSNSIH